MLARLAALAVLIGAFSDCNGCGADKPYTPFGVASSLSGEASAPAAATTAPAAPTAATSGAPAGFAPRKAEFVPGAPASWSGAGLSLSAPKARAFAQVLTADFNGDEKTDALAWLVPDETAKNAPSGELWYFSNGAPPRMLTPLPSFVPNSPNCPLTVQLAQTGPHSATLDVAATCSPPLVARSPTRAIVVTSPSVERPILLTLRSATPAPGESLNISVDSSDQDHDGRDDVKVTLSVGATESNEPANADLIWLDRAAGASREASEPLASLVRTALKFSARARARHGDHHLDWSRNVLRLMSTLCAEGGVARVFDEEGSAFRCGDLARVIDPLLSSDAESAILQGNVQEAFAILARDGWYFAKFSASQRKALERELLRAVSRYEVSDWFAARTAPLTPRLPHYSPLWFEADGSLLIRSDAGVTRLAPDHATETTVAADGGVPSWPLELRSAGGVRITGTSHACDRSELLINASDAAHLLLSPLTSRLLAARPASCAGRGVGPSVTIAPISFDGSSLDALLAGSLVNTNASDQKPEGLPAMGTPRSPNGKTLVTPGALGLLLTGDRRELWQFDQLQSHANPAKFSDCVVANDASAVACLDGGRAIIFARPPKPARAAEERAKTTPKVKSRR